MANNAQKEANAIARERLEWEKAQAEQKSKQESAANGPAGIGGGVLGMGASIAGMIPSLLSGGLQKRQLEKTQRGDGAGASLARRTASEAGRRVVGAAGQRGGSGALREGLRAADRITAEGAAQAATTGAREGLAATQMLRQNELQRRQKFQQLGAGVGQGLAGIGGMLAASRDQGPVQAGEPTDTLPGEAAMAGYGPATGVTGDTSGMVTQTGEAVDRADTQATMAADHADTQATMEGFVRTAEGAKSKANAAYDAQMDKQIQGVAQLATTVAEKQDSAQIYMNTSGQKGDFVPMMSVPPPMTDPEGMQDWIYNQANNFNPGPVLYQGMPPEEAALLLQELGYPVDYQRLGIPDPAAPEQPAKASRPRSAHGRLEEKAVTGARKAGEKIRSMFTGGD